MRQGGHLPGASGPSRGGGLPPWAAKTKIKVVPDKKTMWQILFEGISPLEDDATLSAIHARIPSAEEKLLVPYTYEEEEGEAKY